MQAARIWTQKKLVYLLKNVKGKLGFGARSELSDEKYGIRVDPIHVPGVSMTLKQAFSLVTPFFKCHGDSNLLLFGISVSLHLLFWEKNAGIPTPPL